MLSTITAISTRSTGEHASWSVRPGHTFESRSVLTGTEGNPIPYIDVEGFPSITSEIGWPLPNMYRAEAAFLCAAYGSLQGLDGIIHFAINAPSWGNSAEKFMLSNPVALGSYPAAALIYRKGYVQEGPGVVIEPIRVEKLFALEPTDVYVKPALDALRAAQTPDEESPATGPFNPLSFFAGRVVYDFSGESNAGNRLDLNPYIDASGKIVSSATGQLQWDYGRGIATMNTPAACGAAGFLGRAGDIQTGDVRIAMRNDYGTVIAAALDGKPLNQSSRILVQCMTIDQPFGWKTNRPDGLGGTITSTGSGPWGVQEIDAQVRLEFATAEQIRVIACNENGYARGPGTVMAVRDGAVDIAIQEDAAYTVIETVSR